MENRQCSRRCARRLRRLVLIRRGDELRAADAANRDRALSILHGLLGVQQRQFSRRPRDRSEDLGDLPERAFRIEMTSDNQHRVVRLVVEPVERLQPADIDVLDVRTRADRRCAPRRRRW